MALDVSSRTTLRLVRDIMAGAGDAQSKLNNIVTAIAEGSAADVCSIYLSRRHEMLELFATFGLAQKAVHHTTLRFGEGLTGRIARRAKPLRLRQASLSPDFAYRPETGEEAFSSFLGVPILHGGQVIGVLTIQHRLEHGYLDDEVEALEIVAMVVAELVVGVLIPLEPSDVMIADIQRPQTVEGLSLADGIARGQAVFHDLRVSLSRLLADDPKAELKRLEDAVLQVRAELEALSAPYQDEAEGELEQVLETMRMFAADHGWLRRMRMAVEQGLSAEAAVERVHADMRARLLRQPNLYFRERIHDLDDLAHRMFRALGVLGERVEPIPENTILLARTLGPAELLDYDRARLKGLVVEEATPTSHVVILAKALGIPMIGKTVVAEDVVREGDVLVIDGDAGQLHVRPTEAVLENLSERVRLMRLRNQWDAETSASLPITADGQRIKICINAGLREDVLEVSRLHGDGVGLFRTELHYMIAPGLPAAGAEIKFYDDILEAAAGQLVTFRTLDLGGDKLLPYAQKIGDDNPALGWRAIRICLDRPTFLRFQLRCMLKASQGRHFRIMFPMVASIDELEAAVTIAQHEYDAVKKLGYDVPEKLELGVMLEVPSLVEMIPEIARWVSFVAVGTNDLNQFLHAADRGNARVANRYGRNPVALLRVLARIKTLADQSQVDCSVCGEMAGRPEGALALMLLGYDNLSMSPASVPLIKRLIPQLDLGALEDVFLTQLHQADPALSGWLEQQVHAITGRMDQGDP